MHVWWYRWFVFGSLYTTIIALVILLNSYYPDRLLGEDTNMGLPLRLYRVTWLLLTVSGVLLTIGSLAFVRAVNEPPMKPLFPCWIHTGTIHTVVYILEYCTPHLLCVLLGTDELLGSWLFFWGTLPAVPYSCCYLYWFRNYW